MSSLPQKKQNTLTNYAIYSNMGIEMGVVIALGVFGGIKIDKWLDCSPLFTLILSLGGVAIAMYIMIRTLNHPKKSKQDEQENTH